MKSIFQSNHRSRRNKPDPQNEQLGEQQPFFGGKEATQPFIQPKLTVGQPDDAYEQEADAVADQVVSADPQTTPTVQPKRVTPLQSGSLQRLATPEEDKMPSTNDERMAEDKRIQEKAEPGSIEEKKDEPIQMMAASEEKEEPIQMMGAPAEKEEPMQKAEEDELQTKSEGQTGPPAQTNLSTRLSARQGAGVPLPNAARTQMEQGIGSDFSDVRIHTDSEAADMNKDLHAQAFTHGQDIYFNSGKFNPESKDGQKLLAHELTHVVQQGGGQGEIQRSPAGKNLEAARFSGVSSLEKTYDNKDVISWGSKGEKVFRVQKALVDTGFLPAGEADGIFGRKTYRAIVAFQKANGIKPDGVVGFATLGKLDEVFKYDKGAVKTTYTVEEYIKLWEIRNKRKLTAEERATLAAGCIGVTALNLGIDFNPPLSNCYSTFAKALEVQATMNQYLVSAKEKGKKAIIFSKRFWSGGDPKKFQPDRSGKVDMTGYDHESARGPGFTNFDYGFYDETNGKWWHANRGEPGMEIYESTLDHYSRKLGDFDRQIFCVAITKTKL